MNIDAVTDSVMLYLQRDFYNIIFKIKNKLYIASGSAPPQRKILGAHLQHAVTKGLCDKVDEHCLQYIHVA
jgi:hypothetical protein